MGDWTVRVVLGLLLWITLLQTAPAAEADEAAVLLQFKQANADNPALAGWTNGSLPCTNSWPYINCSGAIPSVLTVNLSGLNLTGTIPPLQGLANLQQLDLSNNGFTGEPPNLPPTLQELVLANNQLTGTLPAGLFQTFGLNTPLQLDLSHNRLSGPLPALTYTPPPFKTLNIGWNLLEGSIPDSWSTLLLNNTNIDARMLRLSGTLPPTFTNAPSYMQAGIQLDNNTCLCGPLPNWYFTAGGSSITFGSTGLGSNCSTCSYPAVTLPVHPDWAGLQSLQAAIVTGPSAVTYGLNATWATIMNGTPCHAVDPNCQLCPLGQPPALCGTLMVNTTGPSTYYCNAQGVACKEGRVSVVNVSWSGLVLSQLPSGLSQLMKLQELGFEGITLNNSPNISVWYSLPGLTTLRLSGNTPTVFDTLPAPSAIYPSVFSQLQTLAISNASYSVGGLPESWGLLTNLSNITLRNVAFLGLGPFGLPASWGNMTNLTSLKLDSLRGLSGSMPASWVTGFTNLTTFKLRNVTGINVTSANMTDFLNQTSRLPATGRPGMQGVAFSGLNLTGTLPPVFFQHRGDVGQQLDEPSGLPYYVPECLAQPAVWRHP
eukprot:GHUV01021193.1.p1 GENE.GHUV01021193.1~~GHUV01021193.1.p1  ORF type:complete len:622 (+),score=117.43 GHUV01021193.1:67-1866(+)